MLRSIRHNNSGNSLLVVGRVNVQTLENSSLCLNHQALLLNQSCPIDSVAIMAGDDWKVEDVIQHLMKR